MIDPNGLKGEEYVLPFPEVGWGDRVVAVHSVTDINRAITPRNVTQKSLQQDFGQTAGQKVTVDGKPNGNFEDYDNRTKGRDKDDVYPWSRLPGTIGAMSVDSILFGGKFSFTFTLTVKTKHADGKSDAGGGWFDRTKKDGGQAIDGLWVSLADWKKDMNLTKNYTIQTSIADSKRWTELLTFFPLITTCKNGGDVEMTGTVALKRIVLLK